MHTVGNRYIFRDEYFAMAKFQIQSCRRFLIWIKWHRGNWYETINVYVAAAQLHFIMELLSESNSEPVRNGEEKGGNLAAPVNAAGNRECWTLPRTRHATTNGNPLSKWNDDDVRRMRSELAIQQILRLHTVRSFDVVLWLTRTYYEFTDVSKLHLFLTQPQRDYDISVETLVCAAYISLEVNETANWYALHKMCAHTKASPRAHIICLLN